MKLLVFGNHTCANRGDAAILRGLLTWLQDEVPSAELVVNSRHPVVSEHLLGTQFSQDRLHQWHQRPTRPWNLSRKLTRWGIPVLMALALRTGWCWIRRLLPLPIRKEIERMKEFDACIQVGGSFYIDLYGPEQFEQAFVAMLADRPVLLAGHSMGPFDGALYRWMAGVLLGKAAWVALRERESLNAVLDARLPRQHLFAGGDTAWLAPSTRDPHALNRWVPTWRAGRPLVGMTMRDIGHFSTRLGITQAEYEVAMAKLVDDIIATGRDVIAVATCTAIGGYTADDMGVARSVAGRLKVPDRFHMMAGEPDDAQLGQVLGACHLVVSTRLHGAIIAMNHGTPALTVAYEHKSTGTMQQLGLGDMDIDMNSLLDGSASRRIIRLLQSVEPLTARTAKSVAVERERAKQMLERLLAAISS
jgi:colanic acid/amylovoran biosynthesis protein